MFDALAVAAIGDELRAYSGSRIQRVVQSGPLSIGIELYSDGVRRWLVATAEPDRAGIWFVEHRIGQSLVPPCPLLLLMRKHLIGARLRAVTQPAFERILCLTFARRDQPDVEGQPNEEVDFDDESSARSETTYFDLIIESTGRLGNIIMVDQQGIIVEAIKRVPPSLNRHRTILPRRTYVGPPTQQKSDPTAAKIELLPTVLPGTVKDIAATLVSAFRGMSPQTAREAVYRAIGGSHAPSGQLTSQKLVASIRSIYAPMEPGGNQEWHPSIARNEQGRIIGFAPYELRHLERWQAIPSISSGISAMYGQEDVEAPIDQSRIVLHKEISGLRERETRKLRALEREIASDEEMKTLRQSGESLFAYGHQIDPGATEATVDGQSIALNPALSVVENAQKLFDRYTRMRDARRRLPEMIDRVRTRQTYLSELLVHLDLALASETVAEIRSEFKEISTSESSENPSVAETHVKTHPGKAPAKRKNGHSGKVRQVAQAAAVKTPLKVMIGNIQVLIGRSARQNDAVTFQLAQPKDLWLHARGIAGAHVIVRHDGQKLDETTILVAAGFAAYHSEARGSARVPVDFTERRHVRKIHNGPPGAVTYSGERTVSVEPRLPNTT